MSNQSYHTNHPSSKLCPAEKMALFQGMLDIIRDRYGMEYPLILADYVHIGIVKAESLCFTNKQFNAMKRLIELSPSDVARSYSND